jgi:predicted ATPase
VDLIAALLGYLSIALTCNGYLAEARSRCDEALKKARQASHAPTLAYVLHCVFFGGWLARAEPTALSPYTDELLALSSEREFPFWRAHGLVHQGWCLAALGRADAGIPLLTTGLTTLHATGTRLFIASSLTLLADAYRIDDQPQVAIEQLAESERVAEETQVKWVLAETVRLRGDLLIVTGDRISAEANFRDAIALAQRQSAKLFELRSTTSLARLWRDQGKRTEARDLLVPVYERFTESFDTPDLKEAKGLLDELT